MLDRNELDNMLETMVRSGASTLHIVSDRAPSLRIRDKLVRSEGGSVSGQDVASLLKFVVPEGQQARVDRGEELDALYTTDSGVRFLGTASLDERGPAISFRRVADQPPTFQDLGLPELLDSFCSFRSGLVLVTGFFGSGKSTTLASMAARILQSRSAHVVGIESPIEYVLDHGQGVVHQREVGRHVASFAAGVREAVRHGADVIVVGAVQDLATVEALLDAVERGALVLAGLQAPSIVGSLERIDSIAAGTDLDRLHGRLAQALRVVFSQTLLPRSHGDGTVPLLENAISNRNIAKAIRAGRYEGMPELMERGRGLGMQTTDLGLKALLSHNAISIEDALHHAVDRDWVYQWGRSRG